jgi:prophage maintenance system killer protein
MTKKINFELIRDLPNIELIEYGFIKQDDGSFLPLTTINKRFLNTITKEDILESIELINSVSQSTGEYAGEIIPKPNPENLKNIIDILAKTQQTYMQKELYPYLETKAANLLYNIIKNHPLENGNKRTGYAISNYFYIDNIISQQNREGNKHYSDESYLGIYNIERDFEFVKKLAISDPIERDEVIIDCVFYFMKLQKLLHTKNKYN